MRTRNWSTTLPAAMLASALLLGCGTTVVNPVTGHEERSVMDEFLALLEPERAALARALTMSARTDAWLGQPMDDPF